MTYRISVHGWNGGSGAKEGTFQLALQAAAAEPPPAPARSASGSDLKLEATRPRLDAGEVQTLRMKLTEAAVRAARKALRASRGVAARGKLTATDDSLNSSDARLRSN